MTYVYQSERGKMLDREYAIGMAPKSLVHEGVRYHRYYGSGSVYFIIPPHMMGGGNKMSSQDANDRQRAFLASDKWKAQRAKLESEGKEVTIGEEGKEYRGSHWEAKEQELQRSIDNAIDEHRRKEAASPKSRQRARPKSRHS